MSVHIPQLGSCCLGCVSQWLAWWSKLCSSRAKASCDSRRARCWAWHGTSLDPWNSPGNRRLLPSLSWEKWVRQAFQSYRITGRAILSCFSNWTFNSNNSPYRVCSVIPSLEDKSSIALSDICSLCLLLYWGLEHILVVLITLLRSKCALCGFFLTAKCVVLFLLWSQISMCFWLKNQFLTNFPVLAGGSQCFQTVSCKTNSPGWRATSVAKHWLLQRTWIWFSALHSDTLTPIPGAPSSSSNLLQHRSAYGTHIHSGKPLIHRKISPSGLWKQQAWTYCTYIHAWEIFLYTNFFKKLTN